MTGGLVTDDVRVISPAPQRVRLSFLSNRAQVDVTLPLDVPVVGLLPQLVKLARVPRAGQADMPEDPSIAEAKNNVWELSRHGGKTPLPPDITLREAGVAEGEMLRLTAERALSAPTLYDDVVDAAARLNKGGFPGWDATAARWMAFAGVHLASAVWVYFLVGAGFAPHRSALIGLAVAVAIALAASAALAHRRYGQRNVGAALGWAVLPISAAVAWVALHEPGGYWLAGGCAAMVVVSLVLFRCVGTGHWGYVAFGVLSGLTGLGLLADTAGLRAEVVGAGLALVATLGCIAVPELTVRFARVKPLLLDSDRNGVTSANASPPRWSGESKLRDTVPPPANESVWARVRSETLTRSALYTGLAVSAGLGAWVVLTSPGPVQWSRLAFALGCAATLGLRTRRPVAVVERSGLAIPAVALSVLSCVFAQNGNQPMPMVVFGAMLVAIVVFAVIGARARTGRLPDRLRTLLAYLDYLMVAALIPLALWAVGGYG